MFWRRTSATNCDNIHIDRTVVICSTRKECDEVNDLCINELMEKSVYEALDTDHHGHPIREADKQTFLDIARDYRTS